LTEDHPTPESENVADEWHVDQDGQAILPQRRKTKHGENFDEYEDSDAGGDHEEDYAN
jgi:hypothetical protein